MPIKNFRGYYNGLGGALEELYHNDIITLATGANKPGFEYKREVFERAADWIHERGGFTPEMLKEQPALDVLNETFRILGGAVSLSITQEVPEELIGALENNAFVFSGFKTYHSLGEVGLSLKDDKGGIKPFEAFRKDVEKINAKYNTNYLYAEYNHAVTSSQMAAKWHDFEQDGDRYDLQYRTAGDELVRAEHQQLHNITLPQSDPFWSQFLPPNGWNCRCTVVQVRKNKYPTSDSAKAIETGEQITADPKAQMFRFNPGKELKLFPDKHPYNKAPKEAKKVVAELAKECFSAKTIEQAEQQFREQLGVNCDLSGFKKKDIGQVKDIFDCVEKHFKDFPELKEKIKFVGSMSGRIKMLTEAKYKELKERYTGYSDDAIKRAASSWARKTGYSKNCYAYSSEGSAEYGLNGLVFNTAMAGDKAITCLQYDVSQKFHPLGCDTVKSVFDHELGHKLDALLGLRKNTDFLKVYNEAVALGEQHITENLSGYAYSPSRMKKGGYTPQAEFIAEAWSEYLNNPNPRPLAATIGKFVENEYSKQKNRD